MARVSHGVAGMIGGKKIDNKHGIVVDGNVDRAILINGDVIIEQHIEHKVEQHLNVIAETLARQINAAPRYLAWENTEARYDTFGTLTLAGDGDQQPTHTALIDWLQEQNSPPVFLLLGEYGMGKTLECQRLYCDLRDAAALNAPPDWARQAIYLDLRRLPQFTHAERSGTMPLPSAPVLIESLIKTDWADVEGARHPGYDEIKDWLSEGALLIVDGLDECLVHLLERQHQSFLAIWVDLLWDATERAQKNQRRLPRLLLSCRSEFFKNQENQQTFFQSIDKFKRFMPERDRCATYRQFVLQPVTEDRIYRYIEQIASGIELTIARDLIEGTHNLAELSRRPITLSFIAENLWELLATRERMGAINTAGLYDLVVRAELSKNTGKHHLSSEHKCKLLSDFSAYLWRQGVRRVPHSVLHSWLHDWLEVLCRADSRARRDYKDMNSERIEEDIRTATLLTRGADDSDRAASGAQRNAKKSEGFGFAHSSYAEYFLAVYLADAVRADRPGDWAMAIPSKETLAFLAQRLEMDQAAMLPQERNAGGLPATLTRWAKTYRAQASELLLEYALRTRRAKLRMPVLPDLRGADFGGAQLSGWRFGERFQDKAAPLLDLSRIRWAGADLRDSYFAHVRLDDGDFTGVRLDIAAFQHCSAKRCDWRWSDLVGTVFRHCRLDECLWLPLRKSNRTRFVACKVDDEFLKTRCELSLSSAFSPEGIADEMSTIKLHKKTVVWSSFAAAKSVAISPDGCHVISGWSDGSIRVWEPSTGEMTVALLGHSKDVSSVSIAADGCRVASGSYDGKVCVWDLRTRRCLHSFDLGSTIHSVEISDDGTILISCSHEGQLKAWNLIDNELVSDFSIGEEFCSISISSNGHLAVFGLPSGEMVVYSVLSREVLLKFYAHTNCVCSLIFSANDRYIVSGSKDFLIKAWDTATWDNENHFDTRTEQRMYFTDSEIRVASNNDAKLISFCHSDQQKIFIYDVEKDTIIQKFVAEIASIEEMKMSRDGSFVVSAHGKDGVFIYKREEAFLSSRLRGHGVKVVCIAISTDGARLASATEDGMLWIWDASTGSLQFQVQAHTGRINSLTFNSDGAFLFSAGDDGMVRLWNVSSEGLFQKLIKSGVKVRILKVVNDSMDILLALDNGAVLTKNIENGHESFVYGEDLYENARKFPGRRMPFKRGRYPRIVCVDPDSRKTAIFFGNSVHVRCVENGKTFFEFEFKDESICCAAFDQSNLTFGSLDGFIRSWNFDSDLNPYEIQRKEISVVKERQELALLSADGRRFVTCSHDNIVRIWDICPYSSSRGELLWELAPQIFMPRAIGLSADARRIVLSSGDGAFSCWSLDNRDNIPICMWILSTASPHGIPSYATWRPGQNCESDELLSARGDAWRFLSWDVEDPAAADGWRRLPLQGYE